MYKAMYDCILSVETRSAIKIKSPAGETETEELHTSVGKASACVLINLV